MNSEFLQATMFNPKAAAEENAIENGGDILPC
jgi:hypothetical protein